MEEQIKQHLHTLKKDEAGCGNTTMIRKTTGVPENLNELKEKLLLFAL